MIWRSDWASVRPLRLPAASLHANPFVVPALDDVNERGAIVGNVFGLASEDYASLRRIDPGLWTCQFGR